MDCLRSHMGYTDAAFRRLGMAYLGMTEVKVLVLKSLLNIDITSPFVAKVRACSQAVWLGLAMGVDTLEVEGDALTIIKKC
ncbi:hypothetical protein Goklo_015979, partial [Gossypium klotzschianum]|nr:hypothetical protein [Gossypium klotzschianum]